MLPQLSDHKRRVRAKSHMTIMEFNQLVRALPWYRKRLTFGVRTYSAAATSTGASPPTAMSKSKDRELCYNMLAEAYHVMEHEQSESLKQLMDWFLSFELFGHRPLPGEVCLPSPGGGGLL